LFPSLSLILHSSREREYLICLVHLREGTEQDLFSLLSHLSTEEWNEPLDFYAVNWQGL
jgi:hypothetical protein